MRLSRANKPIVLQPARAGTGVVVRAESIVAAKPSKVLEVRQKLKEPASRRTRPRLSAGDLQAVIHPAARANELGLPGQKCNIISRFCPKHLKLLKKPCRRLVSPGTWGQRRVTGIAPFASTSGMPISAGNSILPIQLTEVALRNSIHNQLTALYGNLWFEARGLISAVPERTRVEVTKVASLERFQRGSAFTVDHVVAGLSFGFWLSLLNSSMTERLWSGNIRSIFPHLPPTLHQPDVHRRLEKLRLFRNAVMHHYAIFDKGTTAEWENIKLILGWICPTAAQFMMQLADPKKVLSAKPTV
jgi:hypothetical protein